MTSHTMTDRIKLAEELEKPVWHLMRRIGPKHFSGTLCGKTGHMTDSPKLANCSECLASAAIKAGEG